MNEQCPPVRMSVSSAALAKAFGCARVVFNDALAAREAAYAAGLPYLTDAQVSACHPSRHR